MISAHDRSHGARTGGALCLLLGVATVAAAERVVLRLTTAGDSSARMKAAAANSAPFPTSQYATARRAPARAWTARPAHSAQRRVATAAPTAITSVPRTSSATARRAAGCAASWARTMRVLVALPPAGTQCARRADARAPAAAGLDCPARAAWCQPGTDDSSWRRVSVPHDFVLEGTPRTCRTVSSPTPSATTGNT